MLLSVELSSRQASLVFANVTLATAVHRPLPRRSAVTVSDAVHREPTINDQLGAGEEIDEPAEVINAGPLDELVLRFAGWLSEAVGFIKTEPGGLFRVRADKASWSVSAWSLSGGR